MACWQKEDSPARFWKECQRHLPLPRRAGRLRWSTPRVQPPSCWHKGMLWTTALNQRIELQQLRKEYCYSTCRCLIKSWRHKLRKAIVSKMLELSKVNCPQLFNFRFVSRFSLRFSVYDLFNFQITICQFQLWFRFVFQLAFQFVFQFDVRFRFQFWLQLLVSIF